MKKIFGTTDREPSGKNDRERLKRYIVPAISAVLFTAAVVGCMVFAIKTGKTLPERTESESGSETEYVPQEPTVADRYGGYAVFDGYFTYSERTEYVEITVETVEPDGSVVKSTERKKLLIPTLSVHGGCFIVNQKDGSRVLSVGGEVLMQSVATVLPAGTSYDGQPLFSVSDRTVTSSGRPSVPGEETAVYTFENGEVSGPDGSVISLPSGFSFAGEAGGYLLLESGSTGLYGLYSRDGWIADPIYSEISSCGDAAFAADTPRGAVLVAYSGETLIEAGTFSEISVSGAAACAYSEASGWVAFDLTNAG